MITVWPHHCYQQLTHLVVIVGSWTLVTALPFLHLTWTAALGSLAPLAAGVAIGYDQ